MGGSAADAGASQTNRVRLSSRSSTSAASTSQSYSCAASAEPRAAHGSSDWLTTRTASAVEATSSRSAAARLLSR